MVYEVNRREFLKILGIAGVASQIPAIPARGYPHFNPQWSYGDYVVIADFPAKKLKKLLMEGYKVLNVQVRETIPWSYRNRIKWIIKKPDRRSFGCSAYWNLGWKYRGMK